MHEVLEVVIDRAGEVHHVPRVAVGHDRQHEHLVGDFLAGAASDASGADQVDIQRQVRTVLLDGPAGDDAHLAQINRIVDLRPGELFVAVFGGGARHERFLAVETYPTNIDFTHSDVKD